ncbi:MAG: asparagine synthase (glutamine-hydrolyzing) [Lachnospiraceae bacterium]|nr:asparagine synthase (glutamine-hydrolyzing) [Lachnospiraceae bacterium]
MCSIMGYCGETADLTKFKKGFERTISRGPDDCRIIDTGNGLLGFRRLSIMGLTPSGMQPFALDGNYVVCNGELYGFEKVRSELKQKGYSFASDSDCEIILPLYREYGTDMFAMLDAEFACIIYDAAKREYIAARDPIGIRPLYYGYDEGGVILFASEPKNLVGLAGKIMPFPPGCYYEGGQFVRYADAADPLGQKASSSEYSDDTNYKASVTEKETAQQPSIEQYCSDGIKQYCSDDIETACANIREKLIAGVKKRLVSDSKVGFLLSGGLDSSLVCAIAAKECQHPIKTFAIGMCEDAIDLKYARQAADFIGSDHTEVYMTPGEVTSTLEKLIELLGTYDITTIRASMGMYLVCKAIHEMTDIRVILTGEISDEIFGYKYTDFAPSAEAFQQEAEKRVRELHMYDVLRADRCISVNSLEARVPFGDLDFVSYVMRLDPQMKLNTYGKGKYLLRHAFEGCGYLPDEILWREKAAFSDAVGHSMVDYLKEYAETQYTDEEFRKRCELYTHARPFTKESLLYRDIFEKYYPGQAEMIVDFWMPNRDWEGCDVNDPSARVLSNYGASGT